MENKFKNGDRVIWDSHFGYDIAIFVGESGCYERWRIKLVSGCCNGGEASACKSETHPYSKELIAELSKKYGYTKDFKD